MNSCWPLSPQKSVELVKCETNDLEVPANADFVIEGYMDPKEPLREEGPFGDHTGYYTLPEPYPVFHITAITHRKDAVYPATIVGMPPMEDFYIGGASVKTVPANLQNELSGDCGHCAAGGRRVPQPRVCQHQENLPDASVQNHARPLGHGPDDVHQIHRGGGRRRGRSQHPRGAVRLCANTDPQRDSIFTKGPADVLDHATSEMAIGSKLGIDATKKLPGEGFKRAWPPLIKMDEEVKAKVGKLFNS